MPAERETNNGRSKLAEHGARLKVAEERIMENRAAIAGVAVEVREGNATLIRIEGKLEERQRAEEAAQEPDEKTMARRIAAGVTLALEAQQPAAPAKRGVTVNGTSVTISLATLATVVTWLWNAGWIHPPG